MPNPLYNQLNQNSMAQAFQQFKRTLTADPKQQVQQLLMSGRMSQAQFNQLQAQATQLINLLK